MLSISRNIDRTPLPLGKSCGETHLPSKIVDSHWTQFREQRKAAVTSEPYPSPPMSGSPLLSTREPREVNRNIDSRPLGHNLRDDGYNRGWSMEQRGFTPSGQSSRNVVSAPLPYTQDSTGSSLSRQMYDARMHGSPLYSPPSLHGQHPRSNQGFLPSPPGTDLALRLTQSAPTMPLPESHSRFESPKAQRKAKGHVASACVPCKRAHLRCDAQRPCSRCLSNGKEDACVDVQHKKRGRPRLRDERDARLDPTKYSHPHDMAARRPINIYSSRASSASFEHQPRRNYHLQSPDYQSRSVSLQSSNHSEQVFSVEGHEHNSQSHASYPRTQPAVAYLNMDFVFIKVSSAFEDAVAPTRSLQGRRLAEVVAEVDHHKIAALHKRILKEQKRRDPNYLPPIFDRERQVIQRLATSQQDLATLPLEVQDNMTFMVNAQPTPYAMQLGLIKEESIYFVVFVLVPSQCSGYLSSIPVKHYQSQFTVPQGSSHYSPAISAYDPSRRSLAEESGRMRQLSIASGSGSSTSTAQQPLYEPSSSRTEYSGHVSHQVPRSELATASKLPQQPLFQLPPIRALPDQVNIPRSGQEPKRDERLQRLTIGGLLTTSEDSTR